MQTETILIIGASSDIGYAVVNKLASTNPNRQFILHYNKNKDVIKHIQHDLRNDTVLLTVQADLRSDQETDQLLKSIPFNIDTLVFAQGQSYSGLITDTSDQIMDDLYHVHVKSMTRITKHFLPSMIRNQQGTIVVISSIWGEIGVSNEVWYSMMKSAQNQFVKSLSKEVGTSNIRVNGVAPGIIATKMNQHLSDEEVENWLEDVPLQRMGQPEEVADAVQFLCSPQSSYFNGQLLRLNGGIN
ncbi:elongation factor P 5-aminopentanone reductase [Alkalibacillus salilacus]|uniref:3-oxoacyl-[acyl-carrier protein] reductase n=1 Tax=Alkalibacillus salilacus TaxID=284582 RepID=A0ABT9VDM5_9BACI|nr:SDR family oxidoreductase [Alkalibacillus salilacus]MDQ0159031.1 3-oxoacyl-[acyl-carrier protein] reductase [Alkalibacillus salilacus]